LVKPVEGDGAAGKREVCCGEKFDNHVFRRIPRRHFYYFFESEMV
jgi:hypothetical protein